jgi:hypothetical protein
MVAVVVVTDAMKSLAESLAPQLYPACSGEQFSLPLVSTTGGPVTHWASLPNVSDGVLARLSEMVATAPFVGQCWMATCEPDRARETFEALIGSLGVQEVEG